MNLNKVILKGMTLNLLKTFFKGQKHERNINFQNSS